MTGIAEDINKYALVPIGADLSSFTENEKEAVKQLVEAAKLIDNIYLNQKWSGNEELLNQLLAQKPVDKNAISFYYLMKGPWDRTTGFILPYPSGLPKAKPAGANFYPEDMTKEEFENWVKTLSPEDQKHATGFYYLIRRDNSHQLTLIPYSEEYKDLLSRASNILKKSASLVADQTLSKFLNSRADAFLSNDYLASEIDWLKISKESKIEVTIGPYEVYMDELFSTKAAFECFIHARDFEASKTLAKFSDKVQFVEDNLPVPDKYKNKNLKAPPIVVVDQLYSAGNVEVPMTAAYNLPNDEEAIQAAGSKLVIIKNVQEGKFENILGPIGKLVIAQDQQEDIIFDAFFTHVLLHEVAHSNGPHFVIGKNPPETVRAALQEYYSPIEEAKADITGLFAAGLLIDHKVITAPTREQFYVTFLSSAFRSIRFGTEEAHGLGQCIQLNYLLEKGGFEYDTQTKTFSVNFTKLPGAISDLASEILIMQGDGDKPRVTEFVNKYGTVSAIVQEALDRIGKANIPIDIRPQYNYQ